MNDAELQIEREYIQRLHRMTKAQLIEQLQRWTYGVKFDFGEIETGGWRTYEPAVTCSITITAPIFAGTRTITAQHVPTKYLNRGCLTRTTRMWFDR